MALGNLKEALKDFKAVVKRSPNEQDARKRMVECEKEYKRIEFERAIMCEDDAKSILEKIGDVASIIVEPNYDGPVLAETGIDLAFVKNLMLHFKNQKKLHRKYAIMMMLQVKEFLDKLESIVDINIPQGSKITVCGDIHGQYFDLMHIFDLNGLPSVENMYLFNGDFVDRGSWSIECILTLFAFKLLYPDSFHMTRGNHETNDMNKYILFNHRVYGFEGETKAKYNEIIFKLFAEIFNALPLGNLIQKKILVIHGGLFSRDNVSMDELRKIDRFKQPGQTGLMCEILWSDPQPEMGRAPSKRGVGLQFGPDVTENFLKFNNLDLIIRSHEVKQEGYTVDHDGKCITIFSAPNYCDSVGNMGAFIHITPDLKLNYIKFAASPHPNNVRPMQYASSVYGGLM